MNPIVLFGERPGPRTDPARPLYPHTTTGAAAKLIQLTGYSWLDYLVGTDRYNVFHDGQQLLGLDEARVRVQRIMTQYIAECESPRFVFVGGEALRAAPQFYRRLQFLQAKDFVFYLPHTSGVNRWYNSKENTALAAEALQAHLSTARGPGGALPPQPGNNTYEDYRGSTGPYEQALPGAAPRISPDRMEEILQQWDNDTAVYSSPSDIMAHSTVAELLPTDMETAVYLIQKLRSHADGQVWGWFGLLAYITGANPVRPENRGRLELMRADWLNWWDSRQDTPP